MTEKQIKPPMRRTMILSALAIVATLAISMGAGYLNATMSRAHHHPAIAR